ncbi:MAG: hypothetical protein K8T90_02575 [Planctomycetes bacterium]|nr:hypothetical protein [Planctomycetota bacterium]
MTQEVTLNDLPLSSWLLRTQSRDGAWSCDLGGASTEPAGPDREDATFEATCYAVLSLANAHAFEPQVRGLRRGVEYLRSARVGYDESARGGGRQKRHHVALRALAVSQAYRELGEPAWRPDLEWYVSELDDLSDRAPEFNELGCPQCAVVEECVTILAFRSLRRAGLYVNPRWDARASAFGHDYAARFTPAGGDPRVPADEGGIPAEQSVCAHRTSEMLGLACAVVMMDAADVPGSDVVLRVARMTIRNSPPRRNRDGRVADHRYVLYGTWALPPALEYVRRSWVEATGSFRLECSGRIGEPRSICEDDWSRRCGPAAVAACVNLAWEAPHRGFLVP